MWSPRQLTATTRVAVAMGLALLGAGPQVSADPLRGFQLAVTTHSIDFFARPDSPVQPKEAAEAERFLTDVRRRLGSDATAERVEYYRVGHRVDVAGLVGVEADGFTDQDGRRVIATEAVHRHELVHVAATELGDPGRFFHEGLAVALARDKQWGGKRLEQAARSAAARTRVRSLVEHFEGQAAVDAYAVAGSFVDHLIRRHGLPVVAEFFRKCADRRAQRDAAFEAAFGRSLEEAEVEWRRSL